MNLVFVQYLGHAGLALAIGLGACLNAVLLFRKLRQRGIYAPQKGWLIFFGRLGAAMAVMAAVIWFATGPDQFWFGGSELARAFRLTGVVLLGAGAYFGALLGLGVRPADFQKRVA